MKQIKRKVKIDDELLLLIVKESTASVANLEQFKLSNDFHNLKLECHKICGFCNILGYLDISELCTRIHESDKLDASHVDTLIALLKDIHLR